MLNHSLDSYSGGPSSVNTLSTSLDISRWQLLGNLASSALLAEAMLTPKPALVDERGSGAHDDLTLESMCKSALALRPFFQEMARMSFGARPSQLLREELAECGRQAEVAMYQATGGSNSHRGAIWCIGLLVAAAAMHEAEASVWNIAESAGKLATFSDRNAPTMATHGLAVHQSYGVQGARGEAQLGFPHVTRIGLPFLKQRRLTGATENSCRLDTLLAIMSNLDDTCLLYRGGLRALETAKIGAQEVLALGGTAQVSGMSRLFKLDSDLLQLRSSPGGSADLLAATLLLDSLDYSANQSAYDRSIGI
jgi:triphosphoribosyl-dephospho-CoA synthase